MSEQLGKVIRVGSRKSELALIQTKHVIERLQELNQEKKFEIHTMSTIGDRVLNVSLPKIGEKSLFTRDLEDALRNGSVDLVVHSLKDLPTALPVGMAIGAILEREDPRDALVLNEKFHGKSLNTLPTGSVIGTSSLRRTAQLRRKYPHLEVNDIRGNLNTRLAKLDAPKSKYAGIILAQAGLVRMGWSKRISQTLEPIEILYAVGQGALAVECRSNDEKILNMLRDLMCIETSCKILAERSFLKTLGGGCSAPVAVCTKLSGSLGNNNSGVESDANVQIIGAVWSLDGKTEIRNETESCIDGASSLELKINTKNSEHIVEEDDEACPRKKVKLIEAEESLAEQPKRDSPKVIDEDALLSTSESGDSATRADLQHLINVHGELFKRCPFYSLHEKDAKNGNSSQERDECPLKIPVGQDFMGKCPYVDTDRKVELSGQGLCPISGKTMEELKNLRNLQDETDQCNTAAATSLPLKCPFIPESTLKTNPSIKPDQCPFLQKNRIVKMIDYDLNKPELTETMPTIVDDSDKLFCGIYKHACYSFDLFKRCEDLGRKLANDLIEKGAMDVMQCAQNEIHGKV